MPSWMPKDSPRDWFYGDPYSKITKGEERLAGDGYAEMFPELKGVDPENYPLEYQYKILSDVAPSADETKALERRLKGMYKRGELGNPGLFEEAQRQKKERRESTFYQEINDADYTRAGQSAAAAAAVKEQLKGDERESSWRGQYWDALRDFFVSNPLEVLTPVAPAHKFIGQETATEHYARTQALGSPMPQWSAPIEDFVKPFINQTLDFTGATAIPAREQHVREIEDYFDMLKYVKARRLERQARYEGDGEAAQRQAQIAKETMIGVDPFGNDYRSFYRALPSDQRDYLQDFMKASTPEEQDRILQLVPENQKRFYEGLWASRYTKALEKAAKTNAELLPDLERMKELRKTQGFEYDDELVQQWKQTSGGRSYSDWYREEVLIPQKMQKYGAPDVNWIGWSPEVDLQQVKTRVVMNEGLNIHDFGLWESNVRKAMYEDNLRDETMPQEAPENIDEARNRLREYLTAAGIRADVRVTPVAGTSNRIVFNTQDSV